MSEKKQKEYPVTQDIIDLFDEGTAAEAARNHAAESLFFCGRAIAYGKKAIRARRKAWSLVNDLYPELDGKKLQFLPNRCAVSVIRP
jgi:hypothetical protein